MLIAADQDSLIDSSPGPMKTLRPSRSITPMATSGACSVRSPNGPLTTGAWIVGPRLARPSSERPAEASDRASRMAWETAGTRRSRRPSEVSLNAAM